MLYPHCATCTCPSGSSAVDIRFAVMLLHVRCIVSVSGIDAILQPAMLKDDVQGLQIVERSKLLVERRLPRYAGFQMRGARKRACLPLARRKHLRRGVRSRPPSHLSQGRCGTWLHCVDSIAFETPLVRNDVRADGTSGGCPQDTG